VIPALAGQLLDEFGDAPGSLLVARADVRHMLMVFG
jgi:hypothetical protein